MTRIVAFSGKKQAGKDTMCEFVRDNADVLFLPVLPPQALSLPLAHKAFGTLTVRTYHLAYKAKKFLVDTGMLTEEQAFGGDEAKSTSTGVLWEDLPHYSAVKAEINRHNKVVHDEWESSGDRAPNPWYPEYAERTKKYPTGPMLAREVMEQFVEGVMRKMYPPSVKVPCLKQIGQESPDIALIADLRRQEEFEGITEAGGKVVRLTRTTVSAAINRHISNIDLDKDRFDHGRFAAVIDNHNLGIRESCLAFVEAVRAWGWLRSDFDPERLRFPK